MLVDPLGITDKYEAMKNSLEPIGKFCEGFVWVCQHPYDTFVIFMKGLCTVCKLASLVVCAAAVLMYIFGDDRALKYVPYAIIIFLVLKILVSLL